MRFRCKLTSTSKMLGWNYAVNPNAVQFGLFEVDLQERELRKAGVKIKLNDQPFQVLILLLERPGEVITREELQSRLWPSDTFVDFDLSLNSAVKKLRHALGDESDNPRFVETLYRRGYRFIAPVNRGIDKHSSRPQMPAATSTVPASLFSIAEDNSAPAPESPAVLSKPVDKSSARSTRRFAAISAACLAVLICGLLFISISRPEPRIVGFTQLTNGGRVHDISTLLTDGRRLYFQAADQSRIALADVSVNGGESALIPTPFLNVLLGDIAPDGSSILIASFDSSDPFKKPPLWILPLPAGSARPVGAWGAPANWSPDGQRLLLADDKNLYESNLDGSDTRKLATLPDRVGDQRISPDGRRIRLTVNNLSTTTSELWEMNRDGSHPHPLLPNWSDSHHECCGRWTQDGRYFVFASFRNGRGSLWALRERDWWFQPKAKPIQLTNGPLDFYLPLPSKDGKKIFAIGGLPRSEVLRFDGESFVPFFGSVSASDLAFSADGKRVAYVSIPEQILWSSKVDGSDRIQLSDSSPGVVEAALPRWSPDGTHIVFMGRTMNSDWRAYLVHADGQGMHELIPGASVGFDPGWSPDGKSIVLAVGDLGATSNKINVLDLTTGKLSPIPGGENFYSPRWSPDGRYIAAMTTDSEKLMLFDCSTHQWSELAQMGIGYPTWSHDGRYIYFDSIFRQDPAFFRVQISDRKLERLASLKEIHRLWGALAEWSGLGPDDSLLVTRDISSPEIYALDWQP